MVLNTINRVDDAYSSRYNLELNKELNIPNFISDVKKLRYADDTKEDQKVGG
jgi:predicted nucleotidyltransferase